ncbi:hypothetical protein DM860_005550 [Cuscuta australis]|uniref:Uncharacterized protein n=1 Tax=Cuscuta australis TaxID=267555 RepID=A0A328DRU6_9ASTE|nr:hypothetical protein DM860_005550 [Cuscuta australis]
MYPIVPAGTVTSLARHLSNTSASPKSPSFGLKSESSIILHDFTSRWIILFSHSS